jgi:group I intron endonuclease
MYGIVYKITNKLNGKVYIGQTIYSLERRWQQHISKARRDSHYLFHNAIRKYGIDSFDLEELESCDTCDSLNDCEIHWIKELNTLSPFGYNLVTGGKSGTPSEDTRKKMSIAKLGGQNALGHKVSEEVRQILREKQLGKLREDNQGSNNGMSKLDEQQVLKIKTLSNTMTHKDIAKVFGVSRATIGLIISGKRWQHMGI